MKISVITPTRKRIRQLKLALNTAIDTADNLKNVELICRIDEDDLETLTFLEEYYELELVKDYEVNHEFPWGESNFNTKEYISKKHEDLEIIAVIGKRHRYHFLNRYGDEMILISKGEFFVWYSDDLELLRKEDCEGWDELMQVGEGQCYVFSWYEPRIKRTHFPKAYPKKYFELNNRFCANFLEDRFGTEIQKFAPIHLPLSVECHHNIAFGGLDEKDENFEEGRGEWNANRRSNLGDEWLFYSLEDCQRFVDYLRENPNKEPEKKKGGGEIDSQWTGHRLNPFQDCWAPGTNINDFDYITEKEWRESL